MSRLSDTSNIWVERYPRHHRAQSTYAFNSVLSWIATDSICYVSGVIEGPWSVKLILDFKDLV